MATQITPGGLTLAVLTDGSASVVTSASYDYDVFGNRTGLYVVEGGVTTTTQAAFEAIGVPRLGADLTNWRLHADMDGGGTVKRRYLSGTRPNQWLGQVDAVHNTRWTLADHLGSVRLVANVAGTVINVIVYDAFGIILSETMPWVASRHRYAGYEWDGWADMHRAGARYLRGVVWLTRDPLGLGPDVNPYRYVGNGPTNGVDPSGHIVIFIHGVSDSGDQFEAWAPKQYSVMRKVWKTNGQEDQIGLQFIWRQTEDVFGSRKHDLPSRLNATDSVSQAISRDTNKQAVIALRELIRGLRSLLNKHSLGEPINILAHSQGTIQTLGAIYDDSPVPVALLKDQPWLLPAQRSGMIDNAIFLNSPLSVDNGEVDLTAGLRSVNGQITYVWAKADAAVRLVNGVPFDAKTNAPTSLTSGVMRETSRRVALGRIVLDEYKTVPPKGRQVHDAALYDVAMYPKYADLLASPKQKVDLQRSKQFGRDLQRFMNNFNASKQRLQEIKRLGLDDVG